MLRMRIFEWISVVMIIVEDPYGVDYCRINDYGVDDCSV